MKKKAVEEKREFDTESYRILTELSQAIMFEWDIIKDQIFVSDNWNLTFGEKPSVENFSQRVMEIFLLSSANSNLLVKYVADVKNGNFLLKHSYYEKFELQLLTNKQQYLWFQFRLLLRCSELGIPERVFCMITDINQQKSEYEELLNQAQNDGLTGLYNKTTTEMMIHNYLESGRLKNKQQALFLIDIDGFKKINDSLGHLFGDAVIAEIAHVIENSFRKTDIVGRFGGDEFMVLFKNVNEESVIVKKAEELSERLRRQYTQNNKVYSISASIGIVLSPQYGTDMESLFQKADEALYYIKSHGKNDFSIYHEKFPLSKYVSTRKFTGQKKEKNKKVFYENIIEHVFKIFHQSTDANTAINLILEVIGRKHHISRTFIIEKDYFGYYSNTYEWCNEGVASLQSEQQKMTAEVAEKFSRYFDENGVFSCVDIKLLPTELRQYFIHSPVQALLECAIVQEEEWKSVIGFEYHAYPREWKNEEIEELSFVAGVLGVFLEQKRVIDRIQLSHMQTLEILDHINSLVYVIDKNSHKIIFLNKKAVDFFGTKEMGHYCYDIISEEGKPCSECPMCLITEAIMETQKDVHFLRRNMWFHVSVSRIHWTKDREVCLFYCHDITLWKKGKISAVH